jgi:HEAT repeat protein
MSRRRIIWINLAILGMLLAAGISAYQLMRGSVGASLYAKTLRRGSARQRLDAARALQDLGASGAPAVPALLEILSNASEQNLDVYALALRNIDAQAAYDFSCALIGRIERGEITLTPQVVDAFSGLGPVAWRAIPLLHGILRNRREHMRSLIPALIDMGDYSDEVLVAIVEDSKDPVYSTRKWDAMLAFDRLGARARPLRAELQGLASDPTPAVSSQAKRVLSQFDRTPKYEMSGLRGFPAQDLGYQAYALDQLSKQGPGAAAAVPDIASELRSRSTLIRFMAAWALAHIGPAGRPAISQLRAAQSDASSLVRDQAAEAIRIIEARQ